MTRVPIRPVSSPVPESGMTTMFVLTALWQERMRFFAYYAKKARSLAFALT